MEFIRDDVKNAFKEVSKDMLQELIKVAKQLAIALVESIEKHLPGVYFGSYDAQIKTIIALVLPQVKNVLVAL